MAYDNPDLRRVLLPPLETALKAMQRADARDETARDTRPLLSLLMRVVEADPRISGHVLTRRTALTAFEWLLEPREGASPEQAAAAQARIEEVAEAVLERAPEIALYGAAAVRLDWQVTGEGAVPSVAYHYDPDELERPSRRREDLRLLSWGPSGQVTRRAVPDDATHLVGIDESHWTGGVLRSVLVRAILLSDGLREWATYIRKLKGIVGAQFEGGVPAQGDEERTTAETALRSILSENYALYSDQLKFEMSRIVEAASGGSFSDFKSALEADIAVAVLGQANTSELPSSGGSRAALQVLDLIRRDIHLADVRRAERMGQALVDHEYRLTTDRTAVRAPWRFVIRTEADDTDPEAAARRVTEMLETGLPFDADEIYATLGMTRPEGIPDVIRRERDILPPVGVPDFQIREGTGEIKPKGDPVEEVVESQEV
jgi:phage gp29-like protein